MDLFEPSDFQKEVMRKLWAMRNNLGTNIIQLTWRMRMRSRIDREDVLSLPIEVAASHVNEIFIDASVVVELFENDFLDQIPGRGFIRIGAAGITWCLNDAEIVADAESVVAARQDCEDS